MFFTKERLHQYYLLMRMDRPIGTWLLLWPTFWALWIAAEGIPPLSIMLIFALGVFVMRSAGCVINDYADRNIDKHIERTRNRPITSGKVTPREALGLFFVCIIIAFILVLFLNLYTILLSIIALALAAIYPFMKRYTHYPQIVLGMAFSWAIPMGFAAQLGSIPVVAWTLYGVTILWIVSYDTMYAMADREEDLKIGVKSTAIIFADNDKLMIALLQIAFTVGMFYIAWQVQAGLFFYLGILVSILFSIYQQYLIRHSDKKHCFQAFLNNHWLGMVIFIGIFLNYLS
ncbi:MAG: 4-hydroxybenzoate octaprenyltransferase [gamma proteobacterium symbiont of Bathyaustriella thionipta]|nr:4-hydroxybenzoate octaprenyltransferase [gamma proteobacterium symbiont of Bathyaustriella thionipta]MCU7951065.1 4-hydroxybenzoate octaprenyltransferase [gamma proteobacterium symbiont of Bathyaustriella thionipta]MCU7954819.1 4-hydroxybenzoate octaprenyltransferase [gamma proteobacterium symbiont of Bathyaustriella thionipta]MCU7957565.1 4-hydroxybenzoate octaprenyltransferase [gamma proteobacterium symbiont of Bathyaustriella thionipta]MCU7968883.1 4-hydroxybenzoate octaprenyltransferase 